METDNWSKGTSLPTPLYSVSCANVNDEIYVLGGLAANDLGTQSNFKYRPDNYVPPNSPTPTMTPRPTPNPTLPNTVSPSPKPTVTTFPQKTTTSPPPIPEFSSWTILLFAALITTILGLVLAKRRG